MMKPNEVEAKIKEYETYVEDTLKRDLKCIQEELAKQDEVHKEWEDVKNTTKHWKRIKQRDCDTDLQIDLGCGVSAFAEVTELDKMYIDIGLGILLEMDHEEANKYADIRLRYISKQIAHLRKLAVNVKVHIKLILLAIYELQSSITSNTKTKR